MAKNLVTLMVFPVAVFLLGGFFAVSASAQSEGIKESCTLVDDLKIRINFPIVSGFVATHSLQKNSVISSQIKPSDNVKAKLITGATGQVSETWSDASQSPIREAIENKWGLICLVNTINSVTRWLFFVLMSISFAMILLAAFFWITSGTNSENQKKAGQMIAAALVGIAIALMSRIIPGMVIGILT